MEDGRTSSTWSPSYQSGMLCVRILPSCRITFARRSVISISPIVYSRAHTHTHRQTGQNSTTTACLLFYTLPTLLLLSSLCLTFQLPCTSVLHFNTQVSIPVTFTAREHKASLNAAIASKHLSLMFGMYCMYLS